MTLQLVTHCTHNYMERMRPYLESLYKHWPAPSWLLTVDCDALDDYRQIPDLHCQRVPKVPGSPEGTDSLQHGAFIDFVPGDESDVLVYTDGDIVMQRAPAASELAALAGLDEHTVACGWNSGPDETLACEAGRLWPRTDPAAYFGDLSAPCYNIGVIAARRSTWRAIHATYMARYADALTVFGAQQRQQWLVCWAIAALGLGVWVLPYSIHLHGCYPLPDGAENRSLYVGGAATYHGEPVLFRHHLG